MPAIAIANPMIMIVTVALVFVRLAVSAGGQTFATAFPPGSSLGKDRLDQHGGSFTLNSAAACVRSNRCSATSSSSCRACLALSLAKLAYAVGPAMSKARLIPRLSDQNPWAQSRSPMDMMRHGWSMSLFHA